MAITWFQRRSPEDLLVYSYQSGLGSTFKNGRADIDLSKLTSGDLTLTLLNLTLADEGTYLCQTTDSNGKKLENSVELKVGNIGERPSIFLSSLPSALSISLSCQSHGWAPAPQVSWIQDDGSSLGWGESESMQLEQDKLTMVKNKVTINAKDEQKVTCRLRNTLLDKEVYETVIITGDFPPSVSPWLIVFIVLLLILAVIILVVFKQYRKKRDAIRVKERQAAEAEKEPLLEEHEKKNAKEEYDKLKKELSKARVVNKSEWARVTKNTTTADMKKGFNSGNPYWEVTVKEKDWTVGVIEDGVDLKTALGGKDGSTACPEKGVCALSMKGISELRALLSSPFPITPSEPPHKLGFLLDWEEKQLSVYDAEKKQRLYTFNTEFQRKAIPFSM
ncbi:putative selection and upkeep of intraepithelial T-cells protein 1 homolog isoform X2 [Polyodon spathula]|nr:putative selection and upkeep of intraepithelial T-cells protein 1 homolog isoform X2 [Polyodon spathula]